MENQIIKSPFSFSPISSDFQSWTYKEIKKGDSLIVLKELELTKAADGHAAGRAHATHAAGAFTAHAGAACAAHAGAVGVVAAAYWKIRDQAKEEFEKTGKIKGFEVLNLRTFDKVWISCYDMRILIEKAACII